MRDYGPGTYGDRWADVYDEWTEERFGEEATTGAVERLAALADGGRVLELAIGTGRVALPLVERGLDVSGIDGSSEMVSKLRSKPGGDRIEVAIGDFADVEVEGRFDLVFVVFNTLFALTTQQDQLRCFRNVTEHLTDGGRFVIEAFVPDLARFEDEQTVRAVRVSLESVDLEASRHDRANQRIASQYMVFTEEGVQLRPIHLRYAWPSELDLMARLAGLTLEERSSDWGGSPFTSASRSHISVYARGT